MYQVVEQPLPSGGAHALRAGVDFLYNDDTITYPRSVRGGYTFSSLANFLAGVYNNSGLHADLRRRPSSRRPIPTSASTRRTSGRSAPRLTLNAGLRYDLQFLETIKTDTNNVSPRVGFAWAPFASRRTRGSRQRRTLLRPRAAARAWPTRCCRPETPPTSRTCGRSASACRPTQAGAPVFPNILSGAVPSVTLVNLTTMDRNMQNAYSRQASVEIEQQLGRRQHDQRRLSVHSRAGT